MITRKEYVDRLKKHLMSAEPCQGCPGYRHFRCATSPGRAIPLNAWRSAPVSAWSDGDINRDICKDMCTAFVGLPYRDGNGAMCPCYQLGADEALETARVAIKAYRKGKHPWCEKEDK